jgi:hypothetical protein
VSDDAPVEVETAEPTARKGGGDFVKTYVVAMALLACVLGYLTIRMSAKKSAYERANASAQAVFGGATLPASEAERPTTIRALAVGILKYLSTIKEMGAGRVQEAAIPVKGIQDTAAGLGLQIRQITPEQSTPNRALGFEELSTTIYLEPADLERLAKFLYNLEASSTKLRVLDVRWQLKPERENPYPPGYSAQSLQVKVGFRRPIARGGAG